MKTFISTIDKLSTKLFYACLLGAWVLLIVQIFKFYI